MTHNHPIHADAITRVAQRPGGGWPQTDPVLPVW